MARKKVVVAGATGLVGLAAVRHFSAAGDAVVALSRRRPPELPGVDWVAADLADGEATARLEPALAGATHLVYAALHERADLIAGWRDPEQIRVNDAMLRHLMAPLERAAPGLAHVVLLQGTKAYGVHVRPIAVPAREGRSELTDQPNFYWEQERFLRGLQVGKPWAWTILRPVLIVGLALGGAMNLVPALGSYAAVLRAAGETLHYPGGAPRVAQAVDAGLLARAIAWAGEAATARNAVFNVTNGDVFTWPDLWPAIAASLGMAPGEARPCRLAETMPARAADWDRLRAKHGLTSPGLADFVGLSFQYADYCLRTGQAEPGPPSIVSTVRIQQAGFHEVMDTEAMWARLFSEARAQRLLPPA